jgi:hypothetical protein
MAELVRPCDTDLPGWCWRVIERIDGQPTRVWWLDLDAHEDGTAVDLSDVAPDPAAPELARTPGPTGDTGPQGPPGETGPVGPGVPSGGTIGQLLAKTSPADHATGWVDDPTENLAASIWQVSDEVLAVDQRVTDTNGVVSALAAMHPVGDGSPLGRIVPSFVGQQYVDRQATCGASVWVATGTTAASWTVLHGDTGWRDMAASMAAAPFTITAFQIRRIGQVVHVRLDVVTTSGFVGGANVFGAAMPAGFAWPSGNNDTGMADVLGSTVASLLCRSPMGVYRTPAPPVGTRYRHLQSYVTPQNWPTVLPGTATAFALDDDA